MKRTAVTVTLISALSLSLLLVADIPSLKAVTEAPQVEWEKNLGALYGYSVLQTADGSIIISGITGEYSSNKGGYHTNLQSVLFKVDLNGEIQWNKTYPLDMPFSRPMIQTRDGGYAIAGTFIIELPPGTGNAADYGWLIKTDSEGNLQWNATFPQSIGSAALSTIIQTQDEGYLIGGNYNPAFGSSHSHAWIIKTNPVGVIEWNQTYDDFITANSLIEKADGHIMLAGYVQGQANWEACLSELDENGNIQWIKTYDNHHCAICLLKKEEGYILAGGFPFFALETDLNGNVKWDKTYFITTSWSSFKSMVITEDGGYLFAGNDNRDEDSGYLVKTDRGGNVEWNATYLGLGRARINAVCQIKGGGYIFTGSTGTLPLVYGNRQEYIWLVKLAPETNALPDNTSPPPDEPAPLFPITWIIAVVIIVIVIGVGLGLLIYLIKRK
jgi:hypothetical protein